MENHELQTALLERVSLWDPHRWAVISWNDDFTTMTYILRKAINDGKRSSL